MREEGYEVFKSSKKMLRSPPKDKESTGLENLKNTMKELLSEFKEERKEQKEYREEM